MMSAFPLHSKLSVKVVLMALIFLFRVNSFSSAFDFWYESVSCLYLMYVKLLYVEGII